MRIRRFSLTAIAVASAACSMPPPPLQTPSSARAQGHVITRDQIRRSGARDAWEAVRRNVNHLRFVEDQDGDPVWIGAVRGNLSLVSPDRPVLLVDGVQLADPLYLREIPAATVAYIHILSSREGTLRYGSVAANGVILVRTASPGRPVSEENP